MELLFALALGLMQAPSPGCAVVDAARPAEYLEYVKLGEGEAPDGESRHRVWLRLRNNSSCELRLPLGVRRTCDGGPALTDIKDGDCVRLPYWIFEGTPQVPVLQIFPDPTWDPIVGPQANGRLASGTSIIFTVPQSHFIDDRMLSVTVSDIRGGGAKAYVGSNRHVLFGRGDLPAEAREALRKD